MFNSDIILEASMSRTTLLIAIFITMIKCKYLLVETNKEKGEDMIDDKPSCACNRLPGGVCGEDGKTYHWNRCEAECHGIKVQCNGECPCSTEGRVCVDGETYDRSSCNGKGCVGIKVQCADECPC